MLTLLTYIRREQLSFRGVRMLCFIGQPTLPKSETDESVLIEVYKVT